MIDKVLPRRLKIGKPRQRAAVVVPLLLWERQFSFNPRRWDALAKEKGSLPLEQGSETIGRPAISTRAERAVGMSSAASLGCRALPYSSAQFKLSSRNHWPEAA